jgi:hypothetical protein
MRKISPATGIAFFALLALSIALASNGFAGVTGATQKQKQVLGPTITVTKDLPLSRPSGFVMCPKGHQAVGGGYDSWRPPDYDVQYVGPAFWNGSLSPPSPSLYRDSGVGVQRPADGWAVAAVRTPSLPPGPDAPLKAIVICAKLVRVSS